MNQDDSSSEVVAVASPTSPASTAAPSIGSHQLSNGQDENQEEQKFRIYTTTETIKVHEFDIKKNGRHRRVAIERHITKVIKKPLSVAASLSTATAPQSEEASAAVLVDEYERVFMRISKRHMNLFKFKKKPFASKKKSHEDDDNFSDHEEEFGEDDSSIGNESNFTLYNDYDPNDDDSFAMDSKPPASMTSISEAAPTMGTGLTTVPENIETGSFEVAKAQRHLTRSISGTKWLSRYLLDLNSVTVLPQGDNSSSLYSRASPSNLSSTKRITVLLKYDHTPGAEPQERHFVFQSKSDAKLFVDTIKLEKENEDQYLNKKLLKIIRQTSVQAENDKSRHMADLKNVSMENIESFAKEKIKFLVEIVGAEHLPPADLVSHSSDPYVMAWFGNPKDKKGKGAGGTGILLHKTGIIRKSLNPVWTLRKGAFFLWDVTVRDLFLSEKYGRGLTLLVYDHDLTQPDEMLGAASIPAIDIYRGDDKKRLLYDLKPLSVRYGNKVRQEGQAHGKIAIRVRRATEHDEEFMNEYKEHHKKHKTTGVYGDDKKVAKAKGDVGKSAFQSMADTQYKMFMGENGEKIKMYKIAPRPDDLDPRLNDAERKRWFTAEEIEEYAMRPSKKFTYVGNGKIAKIYLEIIGCDNLPNMDLGVLGNKTDAFVQIVYEDCICKTEVINDKSNPRFMPWTRRAFVLHTTYPSSVINLGVFDYDPGLSMINDHDFIGRAAVDVTNLRPDTEYLLNYTLYDSALVEERKANGTVKIRIRLEVDNPKAYLLASLCLPPPIYVNSKGAKEFECVHQACFGLHNVQNYSLDHIWTLAYELLSHQRLYYYVGDYMSNLFFWRGSHHVTIAGVDCFVPLNSICAFLITTTVVEKPRLLPSFSFLMLAWALLASMGLRQSHPNPWWRCNTFPDLLRILISGDKAGMRPETIEENERAEEAKEFDETWKKIIEKAEKKAAEIAEEQQQLYKEIEDLGGQGFAIANKLDDGCILGTLNPLNIVKSYLYPIQQYLLVINQWVRFARNIFLWEESYYSFWITLVSLALALAFLFIPWVWITYWTAKITVWVLFGPWMKLVDVYILKTGQEGQEQHAEEIAKQGRMKLMEKTILETRVENEKKIKLRDFAQYFFGKFLTKVPILKNDRHIDVPLPSSTARPYERENEQSLNEASGTLENGNVVRERGHHLVGDMIPNVQETLPSIEDKNKIGEDNNPVGMQDSLKIGGAVVLAAFVTYFVVPILAYCVQSLAKFVTGN